SPSRSVVSKMVIRCDTEVSLHHHVLVDIRGAMHGVNRFQPALRLRCHIVQRRPSPRIAPIRGGVLRERMRTITYLPTGREAMDRSTAWQQVIHYAQQRKGSVFPRAR